MTGTSRPSALDLLVLASRTAFAARGKPGRDPFLLLTAARLERRVEVTQLTMPDPIARFLSEAAPSGQDGAGDGLTEFEGLLAEAQSTAGDEAKLIAQLAQELRAMPRPAETAWRWSGTLRGGTRLSWRIKAPDTETAQLMLAWSGAEGGRLEVSAGGATLAEVCDRGAAVLAIARDGETLLVAIANPGRSEARFALGLGWDPGVDHAARRPHALPKS